MIRFPSGQFGQSAGRVQLNANDRKELTRVVNVLEQQLKRIPLQIGESRQASIRRVMIEPPIGIDYEVIEDDKKVFVLAVWLI